MRTVYLREIATGIYQLFNEHNDSISDKQQFYTAAEALDWARRWSSSWVGIDLQFEGQDDEGNSRDK